VKFEVNELDEVEGRVWSARRAERGLRMVPKVPEYLTIADLKFSHICMGEECYRLAKEEDLPVR